ncbi:mechanosensitive ion channel family protein [Flavobacterium capsici]|uniref:Mechanosensitive ion channel family protein n=1 Tax=Flavobacterium capsici TaxID=3075618 RepID=A0AA96F3Z0_9FLAO|nr:MULTISPECIES: mechanosensitive ion channel family protein [unclassified Flavobacterium]WNM18577.1 mechanosensitive ion channel family protein [Flavobacterium sp. PMR2A8]WNM22628.1 mechanosensitive ion channel family protein [Flavobacterium sp. PMTSA4]
MKYKLSLLLLFIVCSISFGQIQDSITQKKKIDSLNTILLNDYNQKLTELKKEQSKDSLKKIELENELKGLKNTDNLKKEELLSELNRLRDAENNRLELKRARIDSLKATATGFPVRGFFNDTLFIIYSKIGSFSAEERAAAISKRINDLKDKLGFDKKSLSIDSVESNVDIVYKDKIIVSITENDAIWNGTTKQKLADNYKLIITNAILKYKDETSLTTLLKEIGLALIVILILVLLIIYLKKLFGWTAKKIEEQEGKLIKGIKLKNYVLFDAQREINVLLSANTLIKWLFIALSVYIVLPILFNIFPWTQDFSKTLFGYILNPLKKMASSIWHYLPNLFTIIIIIIVFRYIVKGMHFLKNEIQNEKLQLSGFYPDWANPTFQILKVVLYAFMFVLIFPYLPGSDSPVFQGVSVFLGFLFTFGSAGSLSNVMAGLVLTYMRLFRIGDRVKIGDVFGDVIEKSLLVTRVKTIKNEIISIPNSTVMSSHTINYSSETDSVGLILHSTVTIGYDVPWKKMHQALIDAANRTELLLKEPKPFVLQTSLDDFYVSYQINAYTKEANKQATIYSDLHQNIQDCCNEAGIEILSPHYRAARDGNTTTIPENYLDKDYKAPSFNVKIKKEE